MYPYHWHTMGRFHRGPSRIVWFLIGAGAATWWIRRKEGERRIFGHCRRVAPPEVVDPLQQPHQQQPASAWPPQMSDIPRAIANMPYAGEATPVQPVSPGARGMMGEDWEPRRHDYQWELEKEQLSKLSRQATDTMAEVTEATLVSVLKTAESLKQKLAEHRAQREQQDRIEKELEEQRRNPPRLV